MKVLIINNAVPFIRGGAEALANALTSKLNESPNISAELLRIPFRWDPIERLLDETLLVRQLRLINVDRVIALKYPAYLIEHNHKTIWLLHQFRQAYDLRDPHGDPFGSVEYGNSLLKLIKNADHEAFKRSRALFTNSPVTQERLRRFNGFNAEVLYPPLFDPDIFRNESDSKYVFAGGRIGMGKRQHLLIEAMRDVRNVKLIIAGPPDDPNYAAYLNQLIESYDLQDRVDLRLGFRPRAEIASLVNNASACAYLPVDEDSLGYVTMEAAQAAKPVLTLFDAGGLLQIVENDISGIVTNPDVPAISEALSKFSNPTLCRRLGEQLRERWLAMEINWDHTLERLIG